MAIRRRVFFSFHYSRDAWRAGQVRNMGMVEGNPPASDNDWEAVNRVGTPQSRGGSAARCTVGPARSS